MNFKILALDLDGTLTNSKKEISKRNKETIIKALNKGVKVVLASGRPVIGIQRLADELCLNELGGYILAYNGGHIIDCATGNTIIKKTIPMEYYSEIFMCARMYGVYALTYNEKGVIAENDTDEYVLKEGYNNSIPVIKVEKLDQVVKQEVVKFMVVGNPEKLKVAYEDIKNRFLGKLNVFFSEPYFLEITPLNIEKASSLDRLLNVLGIKQEELIACGDGLNDISMLKYAGFAVAMGNAYEETKQCADCVVASNEEDGVAEAIEKYIL